MKRLKFYPSDWQARFLAGLSVGESALLVWPVKPQPKFTMYEWHTMVVGDGVLLQPDLYFNGITPHSPGDKVWVAEKWNHEGLLGTRYKATCEYQDPDWCSPVTMPKWASRTHLEVLSVECKRVSEMAYQEAGQTGIATNMPQYTNVDYLALKMFKDYWLSRYSKDAGEWYAWFMEAESWGGNRCIS